MSGSDNSYPVREVLKAYKDFLDRVDQLILGLNDVHAARMVCRAGCSSCCRHLTLLPLEWFHIKKERDPGYSPDPSSLTDEDCPFLENRLCQIYKIRPLICRTHGLPLLYLTDDCQWQLSHCPLNFSEVEEEDMEHVFTPGTCLNMEELNEELSRLNNAFIKAKGGENPPPARLSMKSLFL